MLHKLWDDVVAGPSPDHGLGKLRKTPTTKPLSIIVEGEGYQAAASGSGEKVLNRSESMPASPGTPATPTTPASAARHNVWRSVFHPGSNLATKGIGAALFDKPASPNSPTVYDWLYSGETRSKHR